MKNKPFILIFALAASFSFYACGGSDAKAEKAEKAAQAEEEMSVQQAMQEAQKALQGDGEAVEVIDFRKLKELLPETLAGLKRTEHTGEKVGMMGFNMSTAKATYGDSEQRLEAAILDFAGAGMALMGAAAWSTVEMDRETDTGYERTGKIEGYKSFEKYDTARKSGETSILVENRFILTVSGSNVEARDLEKAIKEIGLNKLARLI